MIPYVSFPSITIFNNVTIQPFGLMVLLALMSGCFVSIWDAYKRDLDINIIWQLLLCILPSAFLLSYAFVVLIYYPETSSNASWSPAQIYASMSSYGGFIGGAIAACIFFKIKKCQPWKYVDNLMISLVVGWIFGRLGCSFVHDHPGKLSNFFLAVNYPGGARHDLGFYEFLYTIFLTFILFFVYRKNPKPGTITVLMILLYTPVRFLLDFLRIQDRLYFGLTPGQYSSITLFVVGLYLWYRLLQSNLPDTVLKNNQSSQLVV